MKEFLCGLLGLMSGLLQCSAQAAVLFEKNARFHEVKAPHAMVATQEKVATQVGVSILQQGGNAVDATAAVCFVQGLTLPRAGGIGGGGFMLLWLHKLHKAIVIDYRETAPSAATSKVFLSHDGHVDRHKYTQSYLSVGVPGAVAGLSLAIKKYGHLSLAQDIAPAIYLARHGFKVSQGLAAALQAAKPRLAKDVAMHRIFFKANGQVYQQGDVMRRPDLANTYALLAKHGAKAFYTGKIAQKIVHTMQAHGGLMTLDDLKNYKPIIRQPLVGHYRGYTVITVPPPSSGGVTLIEMLNMLEHYNLSHMGFLSARLLHLYIEVMNVAYRDRNIEIGDPAFVKVPVAQLISKAYANKLVKEINLKQHTPAAAISKLKPLVQESHETTQVSVADKQGNLAATTYSLNYSFGNGKAVPGTGILLNNTLADFTAKVGVANPFGLIQGANNLLAPNKRPVSSMTPLMVIAPKGTLMLATGSPGGARIITTVLQFMLDWIDFHTNLATATETPRIHSQLWPDKVFVEQGLSADTLRLLAKMGHVIVPIAAMGSLQTVAIGSGHDYGFADTRRIGASAQGY